MCHRDGLPGAQAEEPGRRLPGSRILSEMGRTLGTRPRTYCMTLGIRGCQGVSAAPKGVDTSEGRPSPGRAAPKSSGPGQSRQTPRWTWHLHCTTLSRGQGTDPLRVDQRSLPPSPITRGKLLLSGTFCGWEVHMYHCKLSKHYCMCTRTCVRGWAPV